jgi:hypothetical protein
MQNFTEAHKKAADVMAKQKFAAVWPQQLQDMWSIGKFLRPTGFERDRSAVLQKLRDVLTTTASKDGTKPGDVIHAAATNALSAGQLADRATALKFLQHVYRARSSGGQSVWVYAPPKSDAGWVFDEINGDDGTIKQRLNRGRRAWRSANRDHPFKEMRAMQKSLTHGRLAAVACASSATSSLEPSPLEKSGSRIPAPAAPTLSAGCMQYEQVKNGLTAGFDQMGGYLAAYDEASGKQLWMLKVYDNQRVPGKEGDVQDVSFKSMTLRADGTLLIENERRARFIVDPKARTSIAAQ